MSLKKCCNNFNYSKYLLWKNLKAMKRRVTRGKYAKDLLKNAAFNGTKDKISIIYHRTLKTVSLNEIAVISE